MGKASKRKKRVFENSVVKVSDFGEAVLPSIFTKYGFFLALFLITITAFLIYSNTFSSPFHFDDTSSIVENYQLRDFSNFWPPSGSRYIGVLSFAVNYYFGGLNVFGYHLVNIIIHIINSLLVWWLVILTFKTPAMERVNINPQLKYFMALFSSLIFISHPIQTQAVTYIVQRFASLATLFYILSIALYIKARIGSGAWEVGGGKRFSHILHPTFYTLSILSAILAMKTKEISLTLPFVIILYEFMFFNPLPVIASGAKQSQGQHFAKRLIYLIPITLTALIIPLSLIGADKPIGDMLGELREAAQETEEISRGLYLLTQFKVIVTYIRLLFLPINQNLDYDYPLSHSLFEPQTFASFLFLSAIFVFAVYLFIRSRKMAKSPLALQREGKSLPPKYLSGGEGYGLLTSFGIFWFFITLSVESSIIPIRDVINEHRLYLPSVGIVIAFSSVIFWAFEKWKIKNTLLIACILLLVTALPLAIITYKRNFVWRDEITLWEGVVGKSPSKARGYNNLGKALQGKELFAESIKVLQQAIKLNPNLPEPHNNLGKVYLKDGLLNEAISEFQTAIQLRADFPEAHSNLGLIYWKKGLLDEAIQKIQTALKIKNTIIEAHNTLGNIYWIKGLFDKAIEEYRIAIQLNPDYPDAHNNLGVALQSKGLLNEAIKEFQVAIRLKPDYLDVHNNLGVAFQNKGLLNEAILEFHAVLQSDPNNIGANYNLGVVYWKKGLIEEAVQAFQTTLKLNPNLAMAQDNLNKITQQMRKK